MSGVLLPPLTASAPARAEPVRAHWLGLLALVVLVSGLRLAWLQAQGLDLFIDEAQYWQWAQALDFGYYSKPPLVAWLIAASTALLGDSTLAIRLPALLAWPLAALSLATLAMRMAGPRAAWTTALLFLSMPGQALGGWTMTPDAFLLLFWSLGLLVLHRAMEADRVRDWLLLGLCIGLGVLAKYSMLVFVIGMIWVLGVAGRGRRSGPWLALGVAALLMLPNLLWNAFNGFETIGHTADIARTSAAGWLHPRHLAEFLAAQWLIFGLLALPWLLRALWRPADANQRWLRPFVLPYLAGISVLALVSHANPNWAVAAYAGGSVMVGLWLAKRRGWLLAALALNVLLGFAVMYQRPLLQLAGQSDPRADLYARVSGWKELGAALQPLVDAHPGLPLISSDRHLLAQSGYYLQPRPHPMQALDLDGRVSNSFEQRDWQRPLPARALWIGNPDEAPPQRLHGCYARVESLGVVHGDGAAVQRAVQVALLTQPRGDCRSGS